MVPRPALGYAMVALAAALFAVNGTVSKVILGSGINAEQLTEVRCAGALAGLTLIALATRPGSLRLRGSELPLLLALGVGGLALVQWSYFFAIHRVEIGIALVIQFVGPILVALWARFVYGEHVRRRIWLALVLAGSALRHINATRAGITGMLEPVLAILVAWAWLGETLNPLQASGATVTLAGIAIAQTSR